MLQTISRIQCIHRQPATVTGPESSHGLDGDPDMYSAAAVFTECQPHPHPTYSLWYLEPHTRRSWLMALLVILYKYQYNQQPLCSQLQALVKIVINTLDSQHHICRRIPPTVVMGGPPSRSRDVSQPSLGVEGEHGPREGVETPPLSPMYSGGDGSGHVSVSTCRGKTSAVYHQKSPGSMETHWEEDVHSLKGKRNLEAGYSTEAEETESELAAIPESKSDSTAHGSSQGSFEDDRAEDVDGKKKISDGASKGTRPVWFLGSDDHSIQQKSNGGGQKWGVREGMKMLVTSSLFTVSPRPILPPSPVETSSKTTSISTATVVTVKEGPSPPPPVQTQHPPPLFLKRGCYVEVTESDVMSLKLFNVRWLLSRACAERAIKMVPHLNKIHLKKDPAAPKPPDTHSYKCRIYEGIKRACGANNINIHKKMIMKCHQARSWCQEYLADQMKAKLQSLIRKDKTKKDYDSSG
ncbi:Protein unc-79 [Homalodisca vitripennis]|nr:Protein unc-79 [Homalodisca vitripennis]